jgi:hypothetical protein
MPPASGDARYALIVAVSEYADSKLHALAAPRNDADRLAAVLRSPEIGGFRSVRILLDPDHATAQREIETFFAARSPLDIAVLHFSGHGFRGQEHDQLFLAMSDTTQEAPFATAVSGDFLRGVLAGSRARRKLVLLDCCHSGAFQLRSGPGGTPAQPVERARAAELFTAGVRKIAPEETQPPENAMGTVVIGAARAPEVSQETENGALTAAVVEGLETGEADVNRTGQISTENLFEYVTDWFRARNLRQHPVVQQRSRSGRFIIARNCMYQPVALPEEVERLLLDPDPDRRAEAVHHLRLLAVNAEHDVADTAFRRLQHLHQFDFADQVIATAAEALYGMAPSARPERVDFGPCRWTPWCRPARCGSWCRRRPAAGSCASRGTPPSPCPATATGCRCAWTPAGPAGSTPPPASTARPACWTSRSPRGSSGRRGGRRSPSGGAACSPGAPDRRTPGTPRRSRRRSASPPAGGGPVSPSWPPHW